MLRRKNLHVDEKEFRSESNTEGNKPTKGHDGRVARERVVYFCRRRKNA